MPPLLEVKRLVKSYKAVAAVNNISFAIEQGVCFGLLGPNGAGKTTTIEVIENILAPTSGEILYKGRPRDAVFTEEVGIQFQHTALLDMLTVRETLETFHAFYPNAYDLEKLMDVCHLYEIQNHPNNRVSGGQSRRIMLALALINDPAMLFLDEPSTGLDPQSRRNLWEIIQTIKKQGKTIILTTHYMEEAQTLCDEIAIMDHGQFIARGTPQDLIKQYCDGVTVALPRESFTAPPERLPLTFTEAFNRVEIQTADINECLSVLLSHGTDMKYLTVHSPTLEDVFLNLTGRQLRD